jgi:hypothetical protein
MFRQGYRRFRYMEWSLVTLFLALCLSPLAIVSYRAPQSNDLVYCPLQKKWVKGADDQVETQAPSLSAICAPENNKQKFVNRSQADFRLAAAIRNGATEKLFFAFVRNDDSEAARLLSQHNLPQPSDELAAQKQNVAVSTTSDLQIHVATNRPTFELPRPPTSTATSEFAAQPVHRFDSLLDHTCPRGPPHFSFV